MKRHFKVRVTKSITKDIPVYGVYIMYFGCNQFYVGRSVNIYRRAYQHKKELEKLFYEFGDMPNQLNSNHYKYNMFMHLINDAPKNHLISFDLLETCDKENMLIIEQKWLDKSNGFPNCSNMGFVSKLSSGDTYKLNNK